MIPKMNALRVGVVGTGSMGRNHLRVLSTMSQFELIGCYDQDTNRCKQFAEQYGITAFESAEQLFNEVDVAHIVVPSVLHLELGIAAAEHGCHVLMEKPLALNVDDAQKITDACEAAGVKLCVGHVERFNPVVSSLMSIIESEDLISLDFRRMSPLYTRVSDTSVVMDLMIHDIDVLNAICPEPIVRLQAQGACIFTDKIDFAQALITLSSGKMASLIASRVTESKIRSLQINAKHAFIDVDYLARTVEISRKTQFALDVGYPVQYTQENIIEKVFVPLEEPLRAEFEHFFQAIVNDKPIGPDGKMGRRAIEMCTQIEQAILDVRG
ncbi:MAG: Gfo/Idh/MocA family oxidoreductase [Coriobacteriia bacterium]|nr:Gfo/Idh/MocA family oxidoreductase [Coriobacteriia bacterium]MCL2749758.1 Gfo/Idh/MocA family oxidoreductase [Coriobacteriia bacterium]